MLADRPKIEQAAQAVFSREGFAVRRVPSEHAGGKWRLRYPSFTGQPANLDVDFNFMYRQPLWDARRTRRQEVVAPLCEHLRAECQTRCGCQFHVPRAVVAGYEDALASCPMAAADSSKEALPSTTAGLANATMRSCSSLSATKLR